MTDDDEPRKRRRPNARAKRRGPRPSKDRHDRLVRHVLARPELIAGELQAVLPPALVAALDWSSLKREPGTFVDEEGESRTDLLFSIALREDRAREGRSRRLFVYVLFEHQSQPDPRMPLRILGYLHRIWVELADQPRHAEGLPPILPVILHHGDAGWTAPKRFGDLLAIDDGTREVLAPYLPHFELLIDDLTRVPELALAERAMHPVARLVLVALRVDRLGHDPDLTARWAKALNEATRMEGPAALEHLLRYLFRSVAGSDWLEALTAEPLTDAAKEGIVTLQQQWFERGIEKGQAALLLKFLQRRFGPLPEAAEARVREADLATLDRWAESLLTADSLDDVLDG